MNNTRKTYELSLETSSLLFEKTANKQYLQDVFTLSEKSKSALLLEALREGEAKFTGDIPDSLRQKERVLKSDLSFYDNLVYEESLKTKPDSTKIIMWNNKLFEVKTNYDNLISSFERSFPSYYSLKYDNSVISLDTVQNRLADDQALLEYSLTDSSLFTLAITRDSSFTL